MWTIVAKLRLIWSRTEISHISHVHHLASPLSLPCCNMEIRGDFPSLPPRITGMVSYGEWYGNYTIKYFGKKNCLKTSVFYLYPGNCWFGITSCFTDQHCVASLLNNFHPRVLDDLRKAIWDFFIWNNIKASKEIWSDVAGSGSDIYIWLLWDCKDKLFLRTCVIVEHILLNFSPIGVNAMIH